ncbi:MAG: SDR family NAD(P)-dependent oxidoreductase [Asgard group archaeon]|nr:SDR family NAD(P)-dependent oxidoreductase [Asgard group archaeon]
MDLELEGKTALVTGASGGIGDATCRLLAQEGVEVIIHYHSNKERAEALAEEIGKQAMVIQANLSEEKQVLNMFSKIEQKKGRLEILICNAGIWPEEYVEVEKMSFDRWKHTLAIDLDSVFLCCRSFVQQLRKFDGETASIILVGSTSAVFGEAGHADYSAAKAAIAYGLAKSLKNEIINVARLARVNVVSPGWTVSPMTEKFLDDTNGIKHVLKTVPLKKMAQTKDVAHMIVVLASAKASGHISGEIITIAGGMEGRVLHLPDEIDITKAFKSEKE